MINNPKRYIIALLLLMFITLTLPVYGRDELTPWKEFVTELKEGTFSPDKIRPYYDFMLEPLTGFLEGMREEATWSEWEVDPEVFTVGNKIHYVLPLTFNGNRDYFCFTFLLEDDEWYFQHLESIFIRLDQPGPLPVSTFPDIPYEKKIWMKEENYVTEKVRLFNFLSAEKGKDFALQWFCDGAGYFLSAQTWVPFVEPSRAFILYACWEEANLKGSTVVLEKLEENEATIRMDPVYFQLYRCTAQLKQQISEEDFREIFETIWQDRAERAGWELNIIYNENECIFEFYRLQQ